jgi:tetratricopeptide (TPR) repeat protein
VKRFSSFAPLIVFLVSSAVYAQTVRYGFAGDDIGIIRDRPLFHDLHNWRAILAAPWWPNALYRPVTALSLAANWVAAGGDPRAFHLVNVLLHGLASVLVYRLALALLAVPAAAVVAGILFGVHPVHVEAVANLVGRAEVLCAIFVVTAVLLYRLDGALAEAGDDRSWRRYTSTFGTLVAAALALGSKESGFALPGLLLLMDWYDGRRRGDPFERSVRRHWVLWLGTVGLAVGWLVLRSRIVGDLTGLEVAPGLEELGLPGRMMVMLPIVLQYLRLFIFPARLSAEYSPNSIIPTTELTVAGVAGAAVLAAGVAMAWVGRRRAPVVTLALGWIAATVFIVANLLVPTGILLAERTLYLASVGVVLVLAWGWTALRPSAPGLANACLVAVVAAGTLRTVTRNPIWRDDTTYLPAMVRDAPESFASDWAAAELARQRGDQRESERRLRRGLRTYPLGWAMWQDLGKLLYVQGRYLEAGDCFWAAWRTTGGSPLNAQRAIQSNLQAGRVDTAEAWLARARDARPWMPAELKLAASDVALARAQFVQSMTLRRQVAWEFPDSARYWALTAEAALRAGQCPEVVHSVDRLRRLAGGGEFAGPIAAKAQKLGCSN